MLLAILKYFLIVVEIICCILLLIVILLQKTKSHGAGLAFGAAMGESLFGGQAGNILTRITVVLTIIFLVDTMILAFLSARSGPIVDDGLGGVVPVERPAAPAQPAQAPSTPEVPPMAMPEIPAGAIPVGNAGAAAPEPAKAGGAAQTPPVSHDKAGPGEKSPAP